MTAKETSKANLFAAPRELLADLDYELRRHPRRVVIALELFEANTISGTAYEALNTAYQKTCHERDDLRRQLEDEAYHHAACLSIAEGVPGWETFEPKHEAARAVMKLRRQLDEAEKRAAAHLRNERKAYAQLEEARNKHFGDGCDSVWKKVRGMMGLKDEDGTTTVNLRLLAHVEKQLADREVEIERLRGIKPEFPPRPPEGEGVPDRTTNFAGDTTGEPNDRALPCTCEHACLYCDSEGAEGDDCTCFAMCPTHMGSDQTQALLTRLKQERDDARTRIIELANELATTRGDFVRETRKLMAERDEVKRRCICDRSTK